MRRRVLPVVGIISAFAIAVTPIVVYAAGGNIGAISVMNEGTETIHIDSFDFDNIATWKTDMDAHEAIIDQKMDEIRANVSVLESVAP